MPLSRRDVLLASSTLPLFSGCSQFDSPSSDIANLTIILVNGQDKKHTYRFALETTEGRQEWSSHRLKAKSKETIRVEPPKKEKVIAIHGSVAGYTLREELQDYSSQKVCPEIYIEYELADKPTILQSTDISCGQ
ncbi:hypothetical protein [Halorussus caseinilyticus]|uniref:Lipoprotein n=1 Tax=Halorussus caseinilyticus TaxID=3034025 RepID=A0ABD5WIW6_9EURY|nr:hypothetical protein [Halorussus sp. DT72]